MDGLMTELDRLGTPMGELVLRRRIVHSLDDLEVHEVLLDGRLLMSSAVSVSEEALARLAMARLGERPVEVVVAGLGLGHTAAAALEWPNVRRLDVVELVPAVIAWHRRRWVPLGPRLVEEPRCQLIEGDFFDRLRRGELPRRQYDAILVDIDDSPEELLHPSHAWFYSPRGLAAVAEALLPGGVLGLWFAEPPAASFLAALGGVLEDVEARPVTYRDPLLRRRQTNVVVLATRKV